MPEDRRAALVVETCLAFRQAGAGLTDGELSRLLDVTPPHATKIRRELRRCGKVIMAGVRYDWPKPAPIVWVWA